MFPPVLYLIPGERRPTSLKTPLPRRLQLYSHMLLSHEQESNKMIRFDLMNSRDLSELSRGRHFR